MNERLQNYLNEDFNTSFSENIINDIYKTKGRIVDFTIPLVDNLDYRHSCLQLIRKDLEKSFFERKTIKDFEALMELTNEELLENKLKDGTKVTKKMTSILKDCYLRKIVDTFNDSIFSPIHITNDPEKILEMYEKVQTCMTQYGCNRSSLLAYIVSPTTFLAYTEDNKSRCLIIVDDFLSEWCMFPIYGKFNIMMELALISYFNKNSFKYCKNIDVDNNNFYSDAPKKLSFVTINEDKKIRMFTSLYSYTDHDILFGNNFTTNNNTVIDNCDFYEISSNMRKCQGCGGVYDEYELDEDGYCNNCRLEYCYKCQDYVDPYNYNYDAHMCVECADQLIEENREKNDYLISVFGKDENYKVYFNYYGIIFRLVGDNKYGNLLELDFDKIKEYFGDKIKS